jgi:hypothetical protein
MKMKLVCLNYGQVNSSLDDKYLVEYDPCRDGIAPDGTPMTAHVVVTDDVEKALDLPAQEMIELWQRVDEREPFRATDGRPNKPLTAFTVEFLK